MMAIQPAWRHAAKALSLISLATLGGAAMSFLAQALLARRFGPAEYGLFASSLITVSLIAPLAGFGLSQFRLKAYGTEGWAAERWMLPSLRFTCITASLALALIVAWALFGAPVDASTRLLLLVLTPVILGLLAVELVCSNLRLEDRYGALALWQMLTPGGRFAVALLAWAVPTLSVGMVSMGYSLVAMAALALAVPHLRSMVRGETRLRGHGPREVATPGSVQAPGLAELYSQAWPYGLSTALYPIFFQISTVLLKYLAGNEHAGRYAVALAILMATYLLPNTVYQKFLLAKLHRWATHDRTKFWQVYRIGNIAMAISGVAVGALLVALAPHVTLLFGAGYQDVSPLLVVLALCVPIRFLSTSVGSVLLTADHMRYRVWTMAAAALVAIALNLALVPRYLEMGAAWATVVAEGVLLYAMYRGVRRIKS